MLQEELRIADATQDKELIQLLEELEDEIDVLREERRHDQFIIDQIQRKLGGMNMGRQSRIGSNLRER